MATCKHEVVQQWWRWFGKWIDHLPRVVIGSTEPDAQTCLDCGHWLPLGPANDGGEFAEAVKVEKRAAFLASNWKPIGGVSRFIEAEESEGWSGWPYRQPRSDAEHTGFLAAQIQNHERDLGEVNWAGDHMADHARGEGR